MSFLNKLFGSPEKENSSETFWKNITSEEDLNKAIEESTTKKVAIFKHSTSCFISKTVLKNFEKIGSLFRINYIYLTRQKPLLQSIIRIFAAI